MYALPLYNRLCKFPKRWLSRVFRTNDGIIALR